MINSVKLFKVKIIEKIKNNQIKINNINKKEINDDFEVGDFEIDLWEIGDFVCEVLGKGFVESGS